MEAAAGGCSAGSPIARIPPRPRNYSWAELMHRVWSVDVLRCPECHGRMRILAALHSPEAIRAILACLGLPPRAPPVAPAEAEPEVEPEIDAVDPGLDTEPA